MSYERIQKLAEQAGFDIEVEDIFKYKPQHSFIGNDENIKKFAELIVRECIDVVSRCNLIDVDPIEHIKVHFEISDFEQMVEKGTKAWADTPDDWVDELRGGAEKP